jgi:hypothetical protein
MIQFWATTWATKEKFEPLPPQASSLAAHSTRLSGVKTRRNVSPLAKTPGSPQVLVPDAARRPG